MGCLTHRYGPVRTTTTGGSDAKAPDAGYPWCARIADQNTACAPIASSAPIAVATVGTFERTATAAINAVVPIAILAMSVSLSIVLLRRARKRVGMATMKVRASTRIRLIAI